MIEKYITALCWTLGPLGTLAILLLWIVKERVEGYIVFLVFLMDLWLVVRYLL